MKKILFILFLTLPFFAFSQNATKWQQNNADKISNYVIEKMNLNSKDAAFFSKVQLAQIVENANSIKEKTEGTNIFLEAFRMGACPISNL